MKTSAKAPLRRESDKAARVVSWGQHLGTLITVLVFFGGIYVWSIKTIATGLVVSHDTNPESHLNHVEIKKNLERDEKMRSGFQAAAEASMRLEAKLEVTNVLLTELRDRTKAMEENWKMTLREAEPQARKR